MDLREYEDRPFRRHPWEVSRSRFFRHVLRRHVPTHEVRSVLDIGAGDGWLADRLLFELPAADATCWDSGYAGGMTGPSDLMHRDRITFTREGPDGRFDLFLFMDLIEHVDDPTEFVSDVLRHHTTADALVLVSVPAWNGLYCGHDAAFSHRRRYSPKELRRTLEDAGLLVLISGNFFHGLLLPRLVRVAREKMGGRIDAVPKPLRWTHGDLVAKALEAALDTEASLSLRTAELGWSPPGLSTWALCRRR